MRPQFLEPVEVEHAQSNYVTDDHGNAVISYEAPVTFHVLVAPGNPEDLTSTRGGSTARSSLLNRDGYTLQFTLYAADGTDFRADDRVTVRGETLIVMGAPSKWSRAYGTHSGITVKCYGTKG